MTCQDHKSMRPQKQRTTTAPHDLDTMGAQVRTLPKLGVNELRAWPVDFSNAYKNIGIRETPNSSADACFVNPEDNAPKRARIPARPIGSSRGPAYWERVVTFTQFLASELLLLTVAAFPDDIFCDEPETTAASGFWAFSRLTDLIGRPTSGKMDQPPKTDIPILVGRSQSGHLPLALPHGLGVSRNYAGKFR